MTNYKKNASGWRPTKLAAIIILALCAGMLVACGTTPDTSVPQQPMQTARPTQMLTGLEFDATKEAFLEEPEHELQTMVASGITPIATFIVVPTNGPISTPVLGISGVYAQASKEYNVGGSWAGLINNEYILIDVLTRRSDPTQGLLRVYTRTLDLQDHGPIQWYSTPSRVGQVQPRQVVWPLMTLVTEDNNPSVTFVFDIATRQWVSPSPEPSPSVMPTSGPSPSAEPSQLPSPSP
jgi:hypothetical protein